jgi:hypothetical protein
MKNKPKYDIMKTIKHLGIVFSLIAIILSLSGFISEMQKPVTVTTNQVTNIKANMACCTVNVTGSPVSEMGVCCWTKTNPTISQKKFNLPMGSRTGTPVYMTGLSPDTKYYVRAFAKSGTEVIYGNEVTFITSTASEKTNSNFGQKKEDKPTSTKK